MDGPAATPGAGGWQQSGSAYAGLTALPTDPRNRNRRLLAVLASRSVPGRHANGTRPRRKPRDENDRSYAMKSFDVLVDALRKSLTDQATAEAPTLLTAIDEQVEQFGNALRKAVAEIAPPEVGSLSPLDRFAATLGDMHRAIDDIEQGRCVPVAEGFAPSEGAMNLCKTVADLGQIALRVMALDFAAPIAEGEQPDQRETLLKVASAEGEILVKTLLPRESAEVLLMAPGQIAEELGAIGIELLAEAGISPQDLAKAFPPKKRGGGDAAQDAADEEDEDADLDEEAAAADEEDADAEDAEFGEEDDMEGGEGTPLENVAKLAAGILIEVDDLMQQIPPEPMGAAPDMAAGEDPAAGGGAEEGVMGALQGIAHLAALIATQADALQAAVDSGDDTEADAYAEKVAKVAELAKAAALKIPAAVSAEGEALQKRASDAEARVAEKDAALAKAQERIAELAAKVEEIMKQPADPKGAARETNTVSKEGDQGLQKTVDVATEAENLWKQGRTGEASLLLIRDALSRPMAVR